MLPNHPVLSSDIFRLGELIVVLELRSQSYLCSIGDVNTTVGLPIYLVHPACPGPVQSREGSANPCNFFR